MFPETLAYRDDLVARLGLSSLRVIQPQPQTLANKDETGLRWSYDPAGCCAIRKVETQARALEGVEPWISGRKGFKSKSRVGLPQFGAEEGRRKNQMGGATWGERG